jgi:hypothetical protein
MNQHVDTSVSAKSMKEAIEDWGDFSCIALPVLMEIVRKGGRYADESIQVLRPSLQVIMHTLTCAIKFVRAILIY